KQSGRGFHAACTFAAPSVRTTPLNTALDQRRETRPLFSGELAIAPKASPAAILIQAPVGTLKPVFARITAAVGNGVVGALASAALPAPSLRSTIAGARVRSSVKSTSGTRISMLCAIPAQSASRRS